MEAAAGQDHQQRECRRLGKLRGGSCPGKRGVPRPPPSGAVARRSLAAVMPPMRGSASLGTSVLSQSSGDPVMMLRPLLSLTLGLEAILLARTLVLIALIPPLVGILPGARAAAGLAPAKPTRRPSGHDIALSLGSSWIFALGGAVVIQADALGLTRLIHEQVSPWWVAPLEFVGVLLLQDTLFYGLHRLMHHRLCYRWLHQGHHHSRHPTGWTAFAFDPGEALLQAGFLVGVVFLIPLQSSTLLALLLTMSAWAVVNHLEPAQESGAPQGERLGRWLIGPGHHGLHHRRPGRNFGLYFTFWDRFCGTAEPSA